MFSAAAPGTSQTMFGEGFGQKKKYYNFPVNMKSMENNTFDSSQIFGGPFFNTFLDPVTFCNKTFDSSLITLQYISNFQSAAWKNA